MKIRTCSLLRAEPLPHWLISRTREGAVAWGGSGVYRLHAGEIRVLYEVDDDAATVYIINIGVIS